ncbi:MAG: shikimate dehydrogenase [Chloroflexi bacterium]|nr:shikimate dehydrogenase [Chloroflexota bacterium]
MTDDTFAFIIHPINIKADVARKYPLLGKILSERQINFFSQFFPPVYISEITGIVSEDNQRELTGWFIACPYTPATMLRLPVERVYKKLVACGEKAAGLGAKIVGLGAYTSVVGDAGTTIAQRLDTPVTTGDSYTVYIAVEAVLKAAREMDIPIGTAKAAVVGATGAIGATCAELLAESVADLILVGRRAEALEQVRERCEGKRAHITTSITMNDIYTADLILTVTNATTSIIEPQHIKPGAVICDVARPRDVSWRLYRERNDVLVIEGGMVEIPGPVDFGFDFGFPPGKAFACMAETMILALEGRYEDYSIGKHIAIEKVREISAMAQRHGFKLSGFRSFEYAVTAEQIAHVKELAIANQRVWSPPLAQRP